MKSSRVLLVLTVLGLTACNDNYKIDSIASNSSNQTTSTGNPSGPTPPGNTPPTCTIQNVTQNLRILFMVDDSGSTTTTDPNFTNRVDTINTFLNKYGSLTNLTYSYSFFGTNTSTYSMTLNSFGNYTSNVFGTASNVTTAMNAFLNMSGDAGWTYYTSAFTRLEAIISSDLIANANENYIVVFMSDGEPNDPNLASTSSAELAEITSITNTLMGLAPAGRITVSSVYFGAPDAQAEDNLTTMAALGGGQFINTNVTTSYSIDNLITVPTQACN